MLRDEKVHQDNTWEILSSTKLGSDQQLSHHCTFARIKKKIPLDKWTSQSMLSTALQKQTADHASFDRSLTDKDTSVKALNMLFPTLR